MKKDNENKLLDVFNGNIFQAEMVKSLLENLDIKAFVKDGIMGSMTPWNTSPGGAGSVTVSVSNIDFDKAKQIVKEYEENIK